MYVVLVHMYIMACLSKLRYCTLLQILEGHLLGEAPCRGDAHVAAKPQLTVQTPLAFKAHHRVRGEVAGFGKVRRADDVVGASAAGLSPGVLWQDMPIALGVTRKTYAAVAKQRHQRTGCEGMIPASRKVNVC